MSSFEICTQPECLLQEPDVDCHALADVIVRVISGEDVTDVLDCKSPIQRYERCTECALRVMAGARPLPTADDVERVLVAGQKSHRRRRRRARREDHDLGC
jgi:hypothetical protein